MASLYPKKSKGPLSIQWGPGEDRETLYLGKVPRRWAEEFCRGLERLVEASEHGQAIDPTTARWLAELSPKWKRRLAAKGLTEVAPVVDVEGLAAYCYQAALNRKLAHSTLEKHAEIGNLLSEYFGTGRQLQTITPGDAEEFRVWVRTSARKIGKGDLAKTTVTQKCKLAKEYFSLAESKRWIAASPFAAMKGWTTKNKAAQAYVDLETTKQLLAAASPEMQTVIALARYGGIRTMSETRALRWEWIDFEAGWMTVFAPKNVRFEHKAYRRVPLYPELLPYLEEAAERSEGATFVLHHGREKTDSAFYNRLERIVRRCGVAQWPGLWNSLRGSKATDLLDAFPTHVVAEWQNDNEATLLRYYAKVTSDHHARATGRHPQIAKELHARATQNAPRDVNAGDDRSYVARTEQMQNSGR